MALEVKEMKDSDIVRLAEIDRSEHVTMAYFYRNGKLETEKVDWQVPRWFNDDRSEHSVQAHTEAWSPYLQQGGTMFAALDGRLLVGMAIYRPKLTQTMAQLAVLHVSADYRRDGIATRLTAQIIRQAKEDGSTELYVSATPSESAVGFYQSQGFRLAVKPHRTLYELEPEDIHMIKTLQKENTRSDAE